MLDGNGVLFPDSRIRFDDVIDGTSSTFAVGECYQDAQTGKLGAIWVGMDDIDANGIVYVSNVIWGLDTGDFRINGPGPQAFGSRHTGGANFAFCDGSVRFVRDGTDLAAVAALAGRNDGRVTGEW